MDSNYLDFGMDSESDEEGKMDYMDSEEEDAIEASTLLKMMTSKIPMPHSKTKKELNIEAFQAEMEMELNRRADAVEAQGGVEFQKEFKRSSTSPNSSLKAAVVDMKASAGTSGSQCPKSNLKKLSKKNEAVAGQRSVHFDDTTTLIAPKVIKDKVKEMYDEIYFDSDEEANGEEDPDTKATRRSRRKFLSNDELFYDPAADDKDQHWIDKQRRDYFSENHLSSHINAKEESLKPLPNSDAVLNCPGCFTVLCLDCQRHEFYENQFRAMFVKNCVTNCSVNRYISSKSERYKSRKRKVTGETSTDAANANTSQTNSGGDTFNPVHCTVCNTEVGVYDSDEVYHFFNVLTSPS